MANVKVTEDRRGCVTLTLIGKAMREHVSSTNQHNGECDVFMQDSQQVKQFMDDYPLACWFNPHTRKREINDGVVIWIDTWEYRHMVGGQSD